MFFDCNDVIPMFDLVYLMNMQSIFEDSVIIKFKKTNVFLGKQIL